MGLKLLFVDIDVFKHTLFVMILIHVQNFAQMC
jgi:hypothetical protein